MLGVGAFGTVLLVRNKATGETYALKQIRKATVVMTEQEGAIRNERDILKMIRNDFVVNLMSTFQDAKCVYMVLECALGGELFTHILNTIQGKQKIAAEGGDVGPGSLVMVSTATTTSCAHCTS